MDNMQAREAEKGHFLYAHELDAGAFPSFSSSIHVPKYFLNNVDGLLSRPNSTAEMWLEHTHFPAIFFGPPGSSSPLHSDGVSSLDCHHLAQGKGPLHQW
jgi:hypothetical protein